MLLRRPPNVGARRSRRPAALRTLGGVRVLTWSTCSSSVLPESTMIEKYLPFICFVVKALCCDSSAVCCPLLFCLFVYLFICLLSCCFFYIFWFPFLFSVQAEKLLYFVYKNLGKQAFVKTKKIKICTFCNTTRDHLCFWCLGLYCNYMSWAFLSTRWWYLAIQSLAAAEKFLLRWLKLYLNLLKIM